MSARRAILSSRLMVLFVMTFVVPIGHAQEWNWTTSQIDSEGIDSSVAVDHEGNVHVSYRFPTHEQLKYAFLPVGSSHWFAMTLDGMLGGFVTGIGLDHSGNPYICYTPGILKLAAFRDRRWTIQQIDPDAGLVSYYCSVRFGPNDEPQLSWYVEAGFLLREAVLRDGIWIARTVDNKEAPGKFNSLAIDHSGNPQLSYIGLTGTKLKYARFAGNDWIRIDLEGPTQSLLISKGDAGMGNSIAIDRNDEPMISYFDTSSLKVAHLIGGKWRFEVVDQFPTLSQWGWRTFRSTIVLDRSGNPHIGYQCPLGLKHAWWDGQRWRTRIILAPAGTTFDGSMAIDDKNNLYFTYTDPVTRALMLAIGRYIGDEQAAGMESSPVGKRP